MPLRLFSLSPALLACALLPVVFAPGCGGDDDVEADAGEPRNARLVILDPPGDSVGLPFNDAVTLRVRYQTDDGVPIPDAPVQFAMLTVTEGEDPGGSALSANTSTTDALGVARVDLHAGAERTHFRVEVSAADAPSARFYVAVSEAGFARLIVTPTHEGWRDETSFDRIELRLYRADELRCRDLDIDELPPPVFPPRSLAEFGGSVTYQSVSTHEPYTLVAWTLVPDGPTRVSAGCMDIGAQQVPPGDVGLSLVVSDRSAVLPSVARLSSVFDLTPLAEAIAAAGDDRPWRTLDCPAGTGQLILECTLDAMAPDGNLDCAIESDDPVVAEVEAHRGPVDTLGCRPSMIDTEPSLDQNLTAGVIAGSTWPTGGDLEALLAARLDTMVSFELGSELTVLGPSSARHRIASASLEVAGATHFVDLLASDRPVLQQSQVQIALISTNELEIGEHGFTLRYGSIAHAAFVSLGLEPAGLGDRADDLGSALVGSVYHASAITAGCPSVSAIICAQLGRPLDCAQDACLAAAALLDTRLRSWWITADGHGLDLVIGGAAPIYDYDDDLRIDAIGRDESDAPTGLWTAVFTLAEGAEVATAGGFGSLNETAPQ